MRLSGQRLWIRSSAIAAMGAAVALFGTAAQAEGQPPPPPVETWTGFSVGVGGGVAILDADINAKVSRSDELGECLAGPFPNVPNPQALFNAPCGQQPEFLRTPLGPLLNIDQNTTSHLNDLSDTGGLFTVQGAYDYQFAPRWVVGAFVDADWSDLSAHARQRHTLSTTIASSTPVASNNAAGVVSNGIPINSATVIDSLVSTDWSISVGGRFGWLATPRTLLYVLGAYTHADLDDARVRVSVSDPLSDIDLTPFNGVAGPFFPDTSTNFLLNLPDSLDGFSLGGGGEVKLGGPWALKMEYRWTHLDGGSARASTNAFETIPAGINVCVAQAFAAPAPPPQCFSLLDYRDTNSRASADFDLDLHTVRAVLTYHFWSGRGYGG